MKMFLFALLTVSALFIGFKANAQERKMINKNAKALVVYFSRTGEQYSVGNITKGNTAFVAEEIAAQTGAGFKNALLALQKKMKQREFIVLQL